MAELTEKQKLFADEYLIDYNATRAYKAAGYAVTTDGSAATSAIRLLRNAKVHQYIKEIQDERVQRVEIRQDQVLFELAKIAFANGSDFAKVVTKKVPQEVIDPQTGEPELVECESQEVEIVDTDKLSANTRAAISGIKRGRNGIEVSSYDKLKALELLGKHMGMFTDKVEVSGEVNNPFDGLTTEELKKLAGDG